MFICLLFTCLLMLSSCEREDAYAIQCTGDHCRQETHYPICQDNETLIISNDGATVKCPYGCVVDHCNQACTNGTTNCLSDNLLQICQDGEWTTLTCDYQCVDGACIEHQVTCQSGEKRCVGSDVEICRKEVWKLFETCPIGCRDGHCISCDESDQRCADANVETCIAGEWTVTAICPNSCHDGKCVDSCSGPDYCQDSATLMQCIGDHWTPVACRNGCSEGKCKPDVQEEVDHRLTNQLCSEEEEGNPDICDHDFKTNELGGVCVDAGPYAYYCFARCDPNQPTHNYYCEDESFAAFQGDCRQISDGSYAIIPTRVDVCEYSGCNPDTGCTRITASYDISPSYCDNYENYCEGTIVHECTNVMETYNCSHNEVCVQFWSNIYCARPCDVEGDVYYECFPAFGSEYSTAITCVSDDNGVLSWQYNYGVTNECPKGCNDTTGLCN
ncbi:MAG: hypothetical protein J6A01_07890 [Proteobacteria bacterium]|nr:hypothetical protein [Pseudomonadota bacterium]